MVHLPEGTEIIAPVSGELRAPEIRPRKFLERGFEENFKGIELGVNRQFVGGHIKALMEGKDFDTTLEGQLKALRLNGTEPDPEYSHQKDLRWATLPEHMYQWAEMARSEGEADLILSTLRKQLQKEQDIADSGQAGMAGLLFGAIASEAPALFLRGGKQIMAGYTSLVGVNELIFQKTDPNRSAQESVINTSIAFGFGATIAAIQTILRVSKLRKGATSIDEYAKNIDAEIRSMETGERPFNPMSDVDPATGRSAPFVERAMEDIKAGKNVNNEAEKIKTEFGSEAEIVYRKSFNDGMEQIIPREPKVNSPSLESRSLGDRGGKSLEGVVPEITVVNNVTEMKSAIGKMEAQGGINADQAIRLSAMADVMPENFFRNLAIGAEKQSFGKPNVYGTYYYFEDVIALFGKSIKSGNKGGGDVLSHEMGHRVMFTMATEEELKLARNIFDTTETSSKTAERLKAYENKNTHFSEWFAFEFQDYWGRVVKEGRTGAVDRLSEAFGKDAIGMASTFDKIIVNVVGVIRRLLKTGQYKVTQEEMLDVFFDSINKRIGKEDASKIIKDIEANSFKRSVRYQDNEDFLTGPKGLANDFEDFIPNLNGAAYSKGPVKKPYEENYTPDPEGDFMMPAWFIEKIPSGPVQRMLQSPDDFTRHVSSYLVEHPFYQNKNAAGGLTPHGVDRNIAVEWLAYMVKALEQTDTFYTSYRTRFYNELPNPNTATGFDSQIAQTLQDTLKGRGGALTKEEFMREVGRAKIRTNREPSVQQDLIPEAVMAARVWDENLFARAGKQAQEHQVFSIKERRRFNVLQERMNKLLEDTKERGMTVPQLKFFNDLEKQLNALNVKIKQADTFPLDKNYFPHLWNQTAIKERRDVFQSILMRELGYTPSEASGKIDVILEGKAFTPIEDGSTGIARSLKERDIPIDTIHVEEFVEMNVASVGRYYASRVGADIELTKAFGSVDMKEVVNRIKENFDETIFRVDPKFINEEIALGKLDDFEKASIITRKPNEKAKKIVEKRDAAIRDTLAIRDKIRGTYGIPDDPTTYTQRGIRVAKMWNATSLLTGGLAATADVGKFVMSDGLKRTIGPMMEAYHSDLGLLKTMKLAKNEANLAGEAYDMYLSMRAALFADLADSLSAATPFERNAGKATQMFFNVALMNQWNEAVKTMASLTTGSRIIQESQNLVNGTINKINLTKLSNVNIGIDDARIIVEQTKKHGFSAKYTRIPKTEKWDKSPEVQAAAGNYSRALGKEINRIIVTPGKGEVPLFMSKPLWSLIFQFKTFAMAATHRTLVPGLQLKDANFISGNIALFGLGAMINELRRYQLGMDGEQKFGDWVTSSIERGGNVGVLSDMNSILETFSDNRFGFRPMLGAAKPYSTTGLDKLGSIAGPTVQQVDHLARVIWDVGPGDFDDKTTDSLRRILYMNKLAHTNMFFDYTEDGIRTMLED